MHLCSGLSSGLGSAIVQRHGSAACDAPEGAGSEVAAAARPNADCAPDNRIVRLPVGGASEISSMRVREGHGDLAAAPRAPARRDKGVNEPK